MHARREGSSAMFLAVDGRLAGLVAVADPMKASAAAAVNELHAAGLRIIMATVALTSASFILGCYWLALRSGYEIVHAQTLAFTTLAFISLAYVFSCRSEKVLWKSKPFENNWLSAAVILGAAFQLLAIYHPFFQNILGTVGLNTFDWGIVAVSSLLVVACIEGFKLIVLKQKHQEDN